jgi:hypothetical protein
VDGAVESEDRVELTACPGPGCDLPAEVVWWAVLGSTDGPIEHVKLRCLGGHGFFGASDRLITSEPTALPTDDRPPRHSAGAP